MGLIHAHSALLPAPPLRQGDIHSLLALQQLRSASEDEEWPAGDQGPESPQGVEEVQVEGPHAPCRDTSKITLLGCGSRRWSDYPAILHALKCFCAVHGRPARAIHGAARGADFYFGAACHALGIPVTEYRAEWERYGRGAGPVRNGKMLTEGKPDMLIAFSKDFSTWSGTMHMCTLANAADVPMACIPNRNILDQWVINGCPMAELGWWLNALTADEQIGWS